MAHSKNQYNYFLTVLKKKDGFFFTVRIKD